MAFCCERRESSQVALVAVLTASILEETVDLLPRIETTCSSVAERVSKSRTARSKTLRPDITRGYLIPVLSSAIKIIEFVRSAEHPLTVSAISTETGVSRSTTYRILRTLAAHGYLPAGEIGIYQFRKVDSLCD